MQIETYKDHTITYTAGYYWGLAKPFTTIKAAKLFIDKLEL